MTVAQKNIAKSMMDDVIVKYGFESKEAVRFCTLIEKEWEREPSAEIGLVYAKLMA